MRGRCGWGAQCEWAPAAAWGQGQEGRVSLVGWRAAAPGHMVGSGGIVMVRIRGASGTEPGARKRCPAHLEEDPGKVGSGLVAQTAEPALCERASVCPEPSVVPCSSSARAAAERESWGQDLLFAAISRLGRLGLRWAPSLWWRRCGSVSWQCPASASHPQAVGFSVLCFVFLRQGDSELTV